MTTHSPPLFSDAGPLSGARKGETLGIGLGLPGTFIPDPPKTPQSPSAAPTPAVAAAAAAPTAQRGAWSATVTRPEPLPKQPKGQWFVAAMLIGIVVAMGIVAFQSFAYFQVQGIVEGRVRPLVAPWDGCTHAINVREGDHVVAGQLLFTIENIAEEQLLARYSDELRVAQAELEAKAVELRFQSYTRGDPHVEIKPKIAQLEMIQAETKRLRQRLEMGQVRSPVGGRVIRRHRFTGEPVKAGESILEILEDDSLRIVVYLPQERGDHLQLGQQVTAYIAPQATATHCVVERLGEQLQAAPRAIDPNFPKSELRLPVYLRPLADQDGKALRLGSKVVLSRQMSWKSSPTSPSPEDAP